MINDNFFKKNSSQKLVISRAESLKFVNAQLKDELRIARQKRMLLLIRPLLNISACALLIGVTADKVLFISILFGGLVGINTISNITNFRYEFKNNNEYIKNLKKYRCELVNYLMESSDKEQLDARKKELLIAYKR